MNDSVAPRKQGEIEINLADLFWEVLSKWRVVVICAVLFALLLGGFKFVSLRKDLGRSSGNGAVVEGTEELSVDEAAEAYEKQKAQIEWRIESLRQAIEEQQYYESHSAYYAIDPYQAYMYDNTYYIDSGYEIIPSMDVNYQPINYTPALVYTYQRIVDHIGIPSVLSELPSSDPSLNYDEKGFISISSDSGNGILSFYVIASTEEQIDALMAAIDDALQSNKAFLDSTICEHTLTLISSEKYQSVSNTLVNLHQSQLDKDIKLATNLNTAINDFNKLTPPAAVEDNSPGNLSLNNILKSSIKYAVLGGVLGVFLSVCWIVLSSITKGRVMNPQEFASRYDLMQFGVLTQIGRANRFDRWIAGHRGLLPEGSREENLDLISATLQKAAGGGKNILILGSAGKENNASLCQELQALNSDLSFCSGGNVSTDSATVRALNDADAVVLVEKLLSSRLSEIDRELARLTSFQKKPIGFILTGSLRK